MKILELCFSPGLGGLELYVLRSAKALAVSDEVTLLCRTGTRLEQRGRDEGLPVVAEQRHRKNLPLLSALRLARFIDQNSFDVIHLHWGNDLALVAWARFFSRRKPAIVYTRQMQMTRSKHDFYHRFLYGQIARIFAITDLLAEKMRDYLPAEARHKVQRFYYGVKAPSQEISSEERLALRREWGFPPDAFVIGLFGRLEPAKGQALLLEALALARRQGVTMHALLVGHEMISGYRETLQRMAEALGIAQQLRLEPFVNEPQRWMQACDVVALTTLEETFGLVLPEAMRSGVAVLGSDRGGVPEIIEDGVSGMLFHSGSAQDLCLRLLRLEVDRALRMKLAENGRSRADRLFNSDEHFRQLRLAMLDLSNVHEKNL